MELIDALYKFSTIRDSILSKRELKTIIVLTKKPGLNLTQIAKELQTGNFVGLHELADRLVAKNFLSTSKKSLYVPQLHAWRVITTYETTVRAQKFLKDFFR